MDFFAYILHFVELNANENECEYFVSVCFL